MEEGTNEKRDREYQTVVSSVARHSESYPKGAFGHI